MPKKRTARSRAMAASRSLSQRPSLYLFPRTPTAASKTLALFLALWATPMKRLGSGRGTDSTVHHDLRLVMLVIEHFSERMTSARLR